MKRHAIAVDINRFVSGLERPTDLTLGDSLIAPLRPFGAAKECVVAGDALFLQYKAWSCSDGRLGLGSWREM